MPFPFRVGQGFDVHALVEGRPLIIGGVTIPHTHGLQGHSDADVLLHAVTDAILGASALGDIGRHFPDTDPVYQGADSRVLLRETMKLVRDAGWQVVRVDAWQAAGVCLCGRGRPGRLFGSCRFGAARRLGCPGCLSRRSLSARRRIGRDGYR